MKELRGLKGRKGLQSILALFYRPAVWITERFLLESKQPRWVKLKEDLEALSPGDRQAVFRFHVQKLETMMAVTVLLVILCLASIPLWLQKPVRVDGEGLKRNAYGESPRQEALLLQIEEESEPEELMLTVAEQKYTSAQEQLLLGAAEAELQQTFLGENASPDEVRESLCLPETLQNGAVKVSYVTIPYGVIDADGTLTGKAAAKGTLVQIDANLHCQGRELDSQFAVMVYPPVMSFREALIAEAMEAVSEADADTADTPRQMLPDKAGGRKLTWYHVRSRAYQILPLLLLVVPLLMFEASDSRIHEQAIRRREQLEEDYPHLLWKLAMMMGAGLTIRETFQRLASDYRKKILAGMQKRYLYEEILYTCRQMQNGCPQAQAYEAFGRRLGLPSYTRLGTLLSQSLVKGETHLNAMLEKEAQLSLEQQKNNVRKKGEKAGTRLLFPMILMLGVVLVVLMVPAMMSM